MDRDTKPSRGPANKIGMIVAAVLIALVVIVALQGLVRGSGEAAGVTQAAPGDDNVNPAPESRTADQK